MPAHSIEFRNAILDGTWATTPWLVELWHDRPDSVGAQEADFGGYAAVEWDAGWTAAEGAARSTDGLVDFGAPSSDGTDACRYWALRSTTTDVLAFSAPLERSVTPTVGGDSVLIRPTVTA